MEASSAEFCMCAGLGITVFGGLTFFLAARRELFVRFMDVSTFGRSTAEIERAVPHQPAYGRSMRFIAGFEIALGVALMVIAVIALVLE